MWRIIKTMLVTQYAFMLEYRAELWLWTLSGSLPIILMGVWNQAAAGGKFSLSSIELVRYFLAVFIVRQFTVVWVIYEFEKEVVEGTLSNRLLQPVDPVWMHLTAHLSERLARMPFTLALIGLGILLYPQAMWQPSLPQILLFVLVSLLAFALRFLIQYTFALCAFWTERAMAIEEFWFLLYLFLSGMIAPIELFPLQVQEVLQWTPFPYMINFPASILIGRSMRVSTEPYSNDVGRGLLVMFGWAAIFWVANRWLWRRGLRRYSGMGA
jgi:ABC-2 type transport system permease protein